MAKKKNRHFSRSQYREIIPFQLASLLALMLTRDHSILYYLAIFLLSISLLFNSLYVLRKI